jgi:mRNA interferase YafQ
MKIEYSRQFRKDFRRLTQARPALLGEFDALRKYFEAGDALPVKYVDHPLKGRLREYRDCHLRPDVVIVYSREPGRLFFARIGSHSELFG